MLLGALFLAATGITWSQYGGGNIGNGGIVESDATALHGFGQSLDLTLPPLGAILLRHEGS